MYKKILFTLAIVFMAFSSCSCGNNNQRSSISREEDSTLEENPIDENTSQSQTDIIILGKWKCVNAQEDDEIIPIMDDSYIP